MYLRFQATLNLSLSKVQAVNVFLIVIRASVERRYKETYLRNILISLSEKSMTAAGEARASNCWSRLQMELFASFFFHHNSLYYC